ncbi:unnamed protein product [Caenorhabditis sp. 36 PRJEB53466]|nr:unnamed protein product [Caenorhabditis sp. 36 PRJEB53466]
MPGSPLFVLLHSISLFSNSFVVYEAQICRFFLQSLLFLVFLERLRSVRKPRKPYTIVSVWKWANKNDNLLILSVAMALLRAEPLFHRCREEEATCQMYYSVRHVASLSVDAQVVRLLFAGISLAVTNSSAFRMFSEKRMTSGTMRILSAVSWPLLAGIFYHCVIVSKLQDPSRANFTAQMIFFSSFACAIAAWRERNFAITVHFLMMPIYLLFGDGMIPALVVFIALSVIITKFVPRETLASAVAILVPFGFYQLGHSPVISAIPWHAGFVGIPGSAVPRIVTAAFVLVHLNFSAISSIFVISSQTHNWPLAETVILTTTRATFACFAASIHRRHLMVWKIFAPKFIFESVLAIVLLVFADFLSVLRLFTPRPKKL